MDASGKGNDRGIFVRRIGLPGKAIALVLLMLFAITFAQANTYFLVTTNKAEIPSSWNTNAAGGGTAATNFSTSGDIFLLTQNYITFAGGTFGAGVTLQIEGTGISVGNAKTLTINGTIIFTSTAQFTASGTLTFGNSAIIKTANITGIKGANCSISTISVVLPTTASYEFNGATQSMTGLPATVNNLTLSGSGTKTVPAATVISGNLSISGSAVAAISGTSNTVGTLTLGVSIKVKGTWGSSSSTALFRTDTYFSGTGIITVNNGSTPKLLVTLSGETFTSGSGNTGTVTNQTAGTSFNIAKISAIDGSNYIITEYFGAKTIGYSGPSSGLAAPSYTAAVTFTSGQSTTTLSTTLTKAETTSITATDGTVNGTASSSLVVSAGTLDHFAISAISTPQTAGIAITGITITAQDFNNNTVTNFIGSVVYGGSAGITGNSVAFTAGQLTGVSVIPKIVGTPASFTVSNSGKLGTAYFLLNHGSLDHFAISAITSPRTSGSPISGITLTAEDAYGNVVTDFNSLVAYGGSAGVTGYSANFSSGQKTGVSITPIVAGTNMTFLVEASGKTGTATFDVDPGALHHFAFNTISSQVAGVTFPVVVTAKDANGNTVSGFVSTASITINSGTISPTTSDHFVSGILTQNFTIPEIGTGRQITATYSSVTGNSNVFDVIAGTKESQASGNWSNASTWSPNIVPLPTDKVIIKDTHTVVVDVTNAVCENLTIEATSAVLQINTTGALTVNGTLTNNVDASSLVIKSDAAGTGSLKTLGSVTGDATVERYIGGASWGWHYLSSPVVAQAISPDFVASLSSTGEDFYTWYEPQLMWVNFKNTTTAPTWNTANVNTNFVPGRGYLVAYEATNTTKEFKGTLNTGPVSYSLTHGGSTTYQYFNLVGNPFPCSIDWDASSGWGRTSLDGTAKSYWIWNDVIGNFGTYINEGIGTNGTSQYITSGQGFMVLASASGALTMNDNVKVHSPQAFLKSRNATNEALRLKLNCDVNSYSDEAIVSFNNNLYDGGSPKFNSMYADAPELWSVKGGSMYSINFLSDMSSVVPLTVKAGVSGIYTLTASQAESFAGNSVISLEDRLEGTFTFLSTNPSYSFKVSEPATIADRFFLHFMNVTGISNTEATPGFSMYSVDGILNIQSLQQIGGKIAIIDMQGRTIATGRIEAGAATQINMNGKTGVYVVSILTGKGIINTKVLVK